MGKQLSETARRIETTDEPLKQLTGGRRKSFENPSTFEDSKVSNRTRIRMRMGFLP